MDNETGLISCTETVLTTRRYSLDSYIGGKLLSAQFQDQGNNYFNVISSDDDFSRESILIRTIKHISITTNEQGEIVFARIVFVNNESSEIYPPWLMDMLGINYSYQTIDTKWN